MYDVNIQTKYLFKTTIQLFNFLFTNAVIDHIVAVSFITICKFCLLYTRLKTKFLILLVVYTYTIPQAASLLEF